MSMGTRAHQVAMYVVFESPLQMLADSPSQLPERTGMRPIYSPDTDYLGRNHSLAGQRRPIRGRCAAKQGGTWYIGAMTNWTARELEIALSFLRGGKYKADILEDGINADHFACDYRIVTRSASGGETLKAHLAPGGGWAAILSAGKVKPLAFEADASTPFQCPRPSPCGSGAGRGCPWLVRTPRRGGTRLA